MQIEKLEVNLWTVGQFYMWFFGFYRAGGKQVILDCLLEKMIQQLSAKFFIIVLGSMIFIF